MLPEYIRKKGLYMVKTYKISLCFFLTLVLLFSSVNVGATVYTPEPSQGVESDAVVSIGGEDVIVFPTRAVSEGSNVQYKNILVPIQVNAENLKSLDFYVYFDIDLSPNSFLSFFAIPKGFRDGICWQRNL